MQIVLLSFSVVEYTIQLANALAKKENVTLMLPKNSAEKYIDQIDNNVKLQLFISSRFRYPTSLLTIHRIVKCINKINPDVIHLQICGPWICLGLPFLKKYPIVTTVHDPEPHLGDKRSCISKFVTNITNRYTDQTIVHGEKLKRIMMEEYNMLSKNIHVIPHGNFSFYKKWEKKNIEEMSNSILFFGRIVQYKGLGYLIRAEPLITKEIPDAKVIIAGRGNIKKYKRMMKNKGNFMIYNHFIPDEMVAKLFQKSSVITLPYIEASQSGIIPTAYAFGKPVVATDVGSIPEVVDNGKTGFIVPPRNVEKLAEAIIEILKNDELRKKMGENAYKKAKEELSWDQIAEKTIEVYENTIKDGRKK